MNDLFNKETKNNKQIDTDVLDFLKYVLSEVLSKITTTTSTINEVTNQVKTLITLSSQAPTRHDLMEKLSRMFIDIAQKLDDNVVDGMTDNHKELTNQLGKVVEFLNKRENEHSSLNESLKNLISESNKLKTELDVIKPLIEQAIKQEEKTTELITSIKRSVFTFLFTIVPTMWGLYAFIHYYLIKN